MQPPDGIGSPTPTFRPPARFVTFLIVRGTLYGLFGPVGLLAGIPAWAGLRLARRVLLPVIFLAGVLLLAAIAGGAIEGGDIGPAVPYRLSGFRWPEERSPRWWRFPLSAPASLRCIEA